MLRTSSGLMMYSGSVTEEANCEGELNPDKASELELVVEEVWAARDEHAADRSRQAATRLFPWSFLRGSHFTPADIIISVLRYLGSRRLRRFGRHVHRQESNP